MSVYLVVKCRETSKRDTEEYKIGTGTWTVPFEDTLDAIARKDFAPFNDGTIGWRKAKDGYSYCMVNLRD